MFLLLTLFKAIVHLPIRMQLQIGWLIGLLFYLLARKRKQIIKTNLKACFNNKSDREIEAITYQNCINVGKGVIETFMGFYLSNQRLTKIATIEGRENITEVKKAGQSIIFLPAHFTPMILAGRILHNVEPLEVIYYDQNNQKFAKEMEKSFIKHRFGFIKNRQMRLILKAIDGKKSLWLPCDQDYGSTIFAKFFNQTASTVITPAKIGKKRNIAHLPVRYIRKNTTYHLIIEKPIKNYPSGDDQKNAQIYNKMVESHVIKNINQYLWLHRRFKTQPQSIADIDQ